ncbi:hypothetical protein [Nocardia sp. NPDC051832]|uniref:hypothetical protein n=1 Tax=Nocardia sp. NPDC051832 TaxID=3155673 RepID=UPI0034441C74
MTSPNSGVISDEVRLQNTANNTAACLGELESHLKALSFVQDELRVAVVSQGAGHAIYNALGQAHAAGRPLATVLQHLSDQLKKTGYSVNIEDLEGAAKVNAALGGDGVVDAGGWSTADTAKVQTNW